MCIFIFCFILIIAHMQFHLLLQTLQGSFLIKLRHVPKAGIGTYSLERTNTEYGDFVAPGVSAGGGHM